MIFHIPQTKDAMEAGQNPSGPVVKNSRQVGLVKFLSGVPSQPGEFHRYTSLQGRDVPRKKRGYRVYRGLNNALQTDAPLSTGGLD